MARRLKFYLQKAAGLIASLPGLSWVIRNIVRSFHIPIRITQKIPVLCKFAFRVERRKYTYESTFYDGVGRTIYWQGIEGYEQETVSVFRKLMMQGTTLVDIGANTGLFSLLATAYKPGVVVHAFEPVPRVYQQLLRHIQLNGVGSQVVCNNTALSNEYGEVDFHVPFSSMASGSLNLKGAHNLEGTIEKVICTTLDRYVAEKRIGKIDLIKIDVEGFEDKVLAGARAVLERDQPAIICECLPICDTTSIERLLAALGYDFYLLTDTGPLKKEHVEPDDSEEFKNYLFIGKNSASVELFSV